RLHSTPPHTPSTLSLHDALPIFATPGKGGTGRKNVAADLPVGRHELLLDGGDARPGDRRDGQVAHLQAGRHEIFARVEGLLPGEDRKSTRLNSSHVAISYAVFCL